METHLAKVRRAFAALGLTPTFEDAAYKNMSSRLTYDCRCGRKCFSSYRQIRLGMEACKPCVADKKRRTNQERYGVNAPLQNAAIREKARETNRDRYGADTPLQSEVVQDKIRATVQARYGVDHALQNAEIRNKTKETLIRRYGVPHCMQHAPTHRKQQKAAYRIREFRLPSGEILEYQGYEHFCITELLAEGVSSEALLRGYRDMPAITYSYQNKVHVYHPDVCIRPGAGSKIRLVEVKSTWTLKAARSVLVAKLRAALDQGFAIEVRVYDEKGSRLKALEAEVMAEVKDIPPSAAKTECTESLMEPEAYQDMGAYLDEILALM